MAIAPRSRKARPVDYPTSDGKPMAETDLHRQDEDQNKELVLYRDVLKVRESFQFDPTEDYLKPPFQGHRLVDGKHGPIVALDGRLPSQVLGLHLERDGTQLRLYDPRAGRRLPTRQEALLAVQAQLADKDAENARLRAELEALRRQMPLES